MIVFVQYTICFWLTASFLWFGFTFETSDQPFGSSWFCWVMEIPKICSLGGRGRGKVEEKAKDWLSHGKHAESHHLTIKNASCICFILFPNFPCNFFVPKLGWCPIPGSQRCSYVPRLLLGTTTKAQWNDPSRGVEGTTHQSGRSHL